MPFDKDFCTRGLVIDMELGNLMKLAEDGTVLRASHGTTFLSEEEVRATYGQKKHWKHFEEMINTVNNIGERFRIFENFFDIPGSLLCARLVDIADRKADGVRLEKYTFFDDVISAYNDAFHPQQFDRNKGGYFPKFKSETAKFLQPCSEDVKQWLKRLRKNHKKTFIITSSFVDFASASMEFVLGSDWKEYFDYFIFFARKPGFFKDKSRQFLSLDGIVEGPPVTKVEKGQFVSHGNHRTLMESLVTDTGKGQPKVLYFGDSLRSDIFPSKRFADWDTVMILEEMDLEIGTLYQNTDLATEENNDAGTHAKHIRLEGPSQLEKEYLTSQKWGSLFTDDHVGQDQHNDGLRYMNTLWGYMIRKYADVAIPRLETITDCPLGFKIPIFNHEQPRQWGFYPRTPHALLDEEMKSPSKQEGENSNI